MHFVFVTMTLGAAPTNTGVGTWVANAARGLLGRGHAISVVTRADGAPSIEEKDGVTVHRIVPAILRRLRLSGRLGLGLRMHAREVARAVDRIHRDRPIDVLKIPDYRAEGLRVVTDGRFPVIMHLHTDSALGDRLEGRLRIPFRPRYRLERAQGRAARFLTSGSRALAEDARARWGLERPVDVIQQGVDAATFSPDGAPEVDARPPIVLFVGRICRWKGVPDIAAAAPLVLARRPDARFRLAGSESGGVRARAERFLRERGAAHAVEWIGWTPQERLPTLYREARVTLMPSRWESVGNVVLESIACGAPVVATRHGGVGEYVRDGETALLVDPADHAALAAAILRVLDDGALARRLSSAGRALASGPLSIEAFAARLEAHAVACRATWQAEARA